MLPPEGTESGGIVAAGRRRVAMDLLAGVVLFFALDAVVFRSGIYTFWLDPFSKDGVISRALTRVVPPAGNRIVLVLGDSRIGEGFSAPIANARATAEGAALTFVNGAVPASSLRIQYLLLRAHVARGNPPAIAVLMTPTYRDDEAEDMADRALDPGLAHMLLGIGDIADFPWTFPSWRMRAVALRTVLLAGYDYKADVLGFLAAPRRRIGLAFAQNRDGFRWVDAYDGRPERLAAREPACEADTPTPCGPGVEAPPANPASARYRTLWLDRIAVLCRQAGIRLVMLEIPRGPYHHGAGPTAAEGSLAAQSAAGALEAIPAEAFRALERPRYFFDDLHLNAEGRRRFSAMLADRIIALPGPR